MCLELAIRSLLIVSALSIMALDSRAVSAAPDCSNNANTLNSLRIQADKADAEAQFKLGLIYKTGQCVPQDDAEAIKWFRKAANQGHAEAQYRLGSSFSWGQGAQISEIEATKWFLKAGAQGHGMAQYRLGLRYSQGRGVQKDFIRAYMWWSLAALNGVKNGALFRDSIAKRMTRAQIVEAEKQVAAWLAKNKS